MVDERELGAASWFLCLENSLLHSSCALCSRSCVVLVNVLWSSGEWKGVVVGVGDSVVLGACVILVFRIGVATNVCLAAAVRSRNLRIRDSCTGSVPLVSISGDSHIFDLWCGKLIFPWKVVARLAPCLGALYPRLHLCVQDGVL
jgi:hypothetical protein